MLSLGAIRPALATNYYVAPTGSNSTAAGSLAQPFATIQYAADKTLPGDVVYVRAGTYKNTSANGAVVRVTRSGTATNWITFRNYPGETPKLEFNGWQGFNLIDGVHHIEVNGFVIQGNISHVSATAAQNQPGSCNKNGVGAADPIYNGGGISADGRPSQSTGHPHHLRFLNNTVYECGAGGISAIQSDYVTIENNLIYNNCWTSLYGGSGISLLSSWNYDTAAGYHMIIRGNRCFGNRLYVEWYSSNAGKCQGLTDGNGIILDSSRDLGYAGRFLVANNLVVNSGGAGVQVFKTDHVDIVGNTLYQNSRTPIRNRDRGEVFTNYAGDIWVQNNIMVTDNLTKVNGTNATTDLTYTNNLYFGSIGTDVTGANAITANPQFKAPSTDWATADFRLQPNSPAIDRGLNNGKVVGATDLAGNPRVVGAQPDLGAYEAAAVVAPLRTPENPAGTLAGLNYGYYQGSWSELPNFAALTPAGTGTVTNFTLSPATQADNFGFRYTGYISVPTDGQYTFSTASDDGSQLFIGSTLVVDNDGLHARAEQSGTIGLKAGKHAITVTYFEAAGGNTLEVSYQGPGLAKQAIPAGALFRVPALRTPENPTGLVGWLSYAYYEGGPWTALPDVSNLTPTRTGTVNGFNLGPAHRATDFAFTYTGYLNIATDGKYTFYANSDDAAQLFIGSTLVVDNTNYSEQAGTIGLKAGRHAISLEYYNKGGAGLLTVSYDGPGVTKQVIPTNVLYRPGGAARTLADAPQAAAGPALEAYPNPLAGGRTTLRYTLEQPGAVRLEVVDGQGRRVALLVDGEQPAGPHEATFEAPAAVSALYHVLLTTPEGRSTHALSRLP